jgi:hypothetical protein
MPARRPMRPGTVPAVAVARATAQVKAGQARAVAREAQEARVDHKAGMVPAAQVRAAALRAAGHRAAGRQAGAGRVALEEVAAAQVPEEVVPEPLPPVVVAVDPNTCRPMLAMVVMMTW